MKKKVLFVCTHNSVRSQMAEAFLNEIYGDRFSAFSAGSDPSQIDPLVVKVMGEEGMDVSHCKSKSLDVFQNDHFDYVVTVCDQIQESCPFFPNGRKRIHKSFSDPARFKGKKENVIEEYKRVRDEIKKWLEEEFGEEREKRL